MRSYMGHTVLCGLCFLLLCAMIINRLLRETLLWVQPKTCQILLYLWYFYCSLKFPSPMLLSLKPARCSCPYACRLLIHHILHNQPICQSALLRLRLLLNSVSSANLLCCQQLPPFPPLVCQCLLELKSHGNSFCKRAKKETISKQFRFILSCVHFNNNCMLCDYISKYPKCPVDY